MIDVLVNGEAWQVPVAATVDHVVRRLTAEPRGIAVAMDGAVVPRASWASTVVVAGARLEVLTAVQGG